MRERQTVLMRIGKLVLALFLWCSANRIVYSQYNPDYPEPISKISGTLLLHGGGYVDEAIRNEFIRLAGGVESKIVIVPTADPYDPLSPRKLEVWRECGAKNVVALHADSREQAADPQLAGLLKDARGVWFCGGRQTKLMEVFHQTEVYKQIEQVLLRGGVIGGTSAGAAIATSIMLVREDLRVGWNLLPGCIVDQHFQARNRQPRLLRALAAHPDRVGLGIDEDTALVVEGRAIRVLGDKCVTVCYAEIPERSAPEVKLKSGERADLVALSRAAQARTVSRFPNDAQVTPVVASGKLFIAGGGSMGDGLLEKFVQLAGGSAASIVYIPCSAEEVIPRAPPMVEILRKAEAGEVSWIHTKDRKVANDPKFSEALTTSTGVWFGGGRQWNFVDSYQNSLTHQRLHELLGRGGVIGGSSAGASIQGDYMPRGDPLGNHIMMAPGYERGLGLLSGVAIDQHFTQRKRHGDMSNLMRAYPKLLGIGIDERTALIVEKSVAEVVGQGKVHFYDYSRPLESADVDFSAGEAGSRYDLASRTFITSDQSR